MVIEAALHQIADSVFASRQSVWYLWSRLLLNGEQRLQTSSSPLKSQQHPASPASNQRQPASTACFDPQLFSPHSFAAEAGTPPVLPGGLSRYAAGFLITVKLLMSFKGCPVLK